MASQGRAICVEILIPGEMADRNGSGSEIGECAPMSRGTDQLSAGANTTSTTNSSVMS
jgi:hypothetical protein